MNARKIAVSFVLLFSILFTACSAGRGTPGLLQGEGETYEQQPAAGPEMPVEAPVAMIASNSGYPSPMDAAEASKAMIPALQPTSMPLGDDGTGGPGYVPPPAGGATRLIIKNGEMRLLVAETDVAIDRITQVAGDLGGYIVSSRVWFQQVDEVNYKYATLTLGIPVDEFERALNRLRALSIRVLDENAAGQDVTDEYVDLKSRLANLVATRDRIRTFLDQAETVEEALIINDQLSRVEAEIEQVQGRMNYIFGRAAYSTVTVQIEPDIPLPEPTPTPTPMAWSLQPTIDRAGTTLTGMLQGLAELGVWIGLVVLPVLLPPLLLAWVAWRLTQKKRAAAS